MRVSSNRKFAIYSYEVKVRDQLKMTEEYIHTVSITVHYCL